MFDPLPCSGLCAGAAGAGATGGRGLLAALAPAPLLLGATGAVAALAEFGPDAPLGALPPMGAWPVMTAAIVALSSRDEGSEGPRSAVGALKAITASSSMK